MDKNIKITELEAKQLYTMILQLTGLTEIELSKEDKEKIVKFAKKVLK
mgnify:CR=1 FL=1